MGKCVKRNVSAKMEQTVTMWMVDVHARENGKESTVMKVIPS